MSFLQNLFGGAPAAQPSSSTTQQPQQPQQQQAPQPTGETPSGEGTSQQQQQQSGEGNNSEVSSLDAYKDLWNNDPDPKDGGKATDPLSDPSSLFNIDPKTIQEAVGRINFAEVVSPEHLQAISEGGENAQKAFTESMNAVARQVFSQSMVGSAKLVEQALGRAAQGIDSRIDGRLRSSQVNDSVAETNPAFNHPAAKPMVQALQQQLAAKHPTASPKEISDMANSFFNEFANSITAPERQKQQESKAADDVDWEQWFKS